MNKMAFITLLSVIMYACNSEDSNKPAESGSVVQDPDENGEKLPNPGGVDVATYDPNRGTGRFTHVDLANKLDMALSNGERKYTM